MANTTLNNVKVLHDVRTTAEWTTVGTTVIPKGYLTIELTTTGQPKAKVGNGTDTWEALPYLTAETNLSDYATKDYVDTGISSAISALGTVFIVKGRVDSVDALPNTDNKAGDVYLVGTEDADNFAEYYWTGTFWDFMGQTTTVDLSNYYTKDAVYTKTEVDGLLNNKVDKIEGKGLSTEDFTTELKNRLNSLENYDDTALTARVAAIEGDYIKSTDKLILNCSIT